MRGATDGSCGCAHPDSVGWHVQLRVHRRGHRSNADGNDSARVLACDVMCGAAAEHQRGHFQPRRHEPPQAGVPLTPPTLIAR